MDKRFATFAMLSVLAVAVAPAAHAQKPLRIDIAPALIRNAPANFATQPAPGQRAARSFVAPQPQGADARDQRLARAEALTTLGVGLLNEPEQAEVTTASGAGYPTFRFQKRGAIARDLRRGYRRMGENLARKVWDEPNGKRIVFDVAGKPGVGVEIPLR
jgi:hypothetical protein